MNSLSNILGTQLPRRSGRRGLGLLFAALLAGCGATLTSTPSGAVSPDDASPPQIAGRVSALEGDVRIWRAEEDGGGQWDAAQLNDVVTRGTGLSVADGRVEVRVGPHAFRMDRGTTGGFDELDFDNKAFALERGVLNVRLAPAPQNESVSLAVAGVEVKLDAPGRYRIDAVDGAPLEVATFEGRAIVQHGGRSAAVQTGQALSLTQSQMSFGRATSTPLDDWALARDNSYAQATVAAQYVSPYMTGYEDLDRNGDWVANADYGTVWVPRAVPAGWVPYRDGRWRWVAPWGWTWVDAAPWGFAPFHYGRWVVVGGRWCWWPGRLVARPVWAPALVGFVGSGGTAVSVSIGGPVVGWYPLAPWHAYRPVYRSSPTYVTVINQTIIQRPPRGVPYDVNQRPGSTWVPGPRFRDPIVKVNIPARTAKVAELQPAAPPPRPGPAVGRTGPRGDDWRSRPPVSVPANWNGRDASRPGTAPGAAVGRTAPRDTDGRYTARPPGDVRRPQPGNGQGWRSRPADPVAQNAQDGRLAPPQPIPGSDRSLSQPAPIRKPDPRVQPRSQGEVRDRTQRNAGQPRPSPRVPQDVVPPYQQLQRPVAPAEPARTPPAAPPTIRQPAAPPPQRAVPRTVPPQRSGAVGPALQGRAGPPMQRAIPQSGTARPTTPKQAAIAMER